MNNFEEWVITVALVSALFSAVASIKTHRKKKRRGRTRIRKTL